MKIITSKKKIFTMDVERDIHSAYSFSKLLEKYGLRGEFYICGYLVEKYPNICYKISKNHVVGGHGFYHENFAKLNYKNAFRIIRDTMQVFKDNEINMMGWRFPGLSFTYDSLKILADMGIYDSSFRLPAMKRWGKFYFLRTWAKNIFFSHSFSLPRPYPANLVEKPFTVVDIENEIFYMYNGRIITHCYNYPNFEKEIKKYLNNYF